MSFPSIPTSLHPQIPVLAPALRHHNKRASSHAPGKNHIETSPRFPHRVPCAPLCLGFYGVQLKLRGQKCDYKRLGLELSMAILPTEIHLSFRLGPSLPQILHRKKLVSDSGVSKNTFRRTLDLKTRNSISCIYKSCSHRPCFFVPKIFQSD